MKKYLFLLLALVVFCGPFLSLVAPARLRDYVYRTYMYQVIAEQASADADNDQLSAERILDFLYTNVFPLRGEKIIDATPLNDLVRGIGWCDQVSNSFAQLASFVGIKAGMVMLKGRWPRSSHTVVQCLLGDRWCILDPQNGVILKDSLGLIAQFADIQQQNQAFSSRKKGDFSSEWFRTYYNFLFEKKYPPTIWSSPGAKVAGIRKLLREMVVLCHRVFGTGYFHLFQDAYLAGVSDLAQERFDLTEPDARLYYRGRNYQLCGRFDKAHRAYQRLIRRFPESLYAERALLFGFSTLMKQHRWREAQQGLEEFIRDKKDSLWITVAQTYLDWCRYRLGDSGLPPEASDVAEEAFYFR